MRKRPGCFKQNIFKNKNAGTGGSIAGTGGSVAGTGGSVL
jgi:hypothetical protein